MSDYPRTIDNGAGELLTFSAPRSDERGELQEATNTCRRAAARRCTCTISRRSR